VWGDEERDWEIRLRRAEGGNDEVGQVLQCSQTSQRLVLGSHQLKGERFWTGNNVDGKGLHSCVKAALQTREGKKKVDKKKRQRIRNTKPY